ncbi:hypothetical protein CIPAW_15G119600 [Carya illinoinensis]|uniref:Uncharacterized protein n=1 Tax=Carya illinoinensis TaxID=32201 RepID=A0A8T1NBK1_CARIL|nr:hypothetical protein CIPAW_15G119600 [Carya illinoinensis]
MHSSFIGELSFIKSFIKFKDMTIMSFYDCNFLKKIPDLSSIPNLGIYMLKGVQV